MKPYRHRRRKHRSGTITHRARRDGDEPIWRPVSSIRAERQEDSETEARVRGYGLEWADVYDAGWFTESFRKGAFADTLEGVRLKVGHDYRTLAIARSPGTMDVSEDDTGLLYAAGMDRRNYLAEAVYSAVLRGDVDGASIGFWPLEEVVTYDYENDEPTHYEVVRAELLEISIVDFPAYESSSAEIVEGAERADRTSDDMRLRLLGLVNPMRGAIELENRHT